MDFAFMQPICIRRPSKVELEAFIESYAQDIRQCFDLGEGPITWCDFYEMFLCVFAEGKMVSVLSKTHYQDCIWLSNAYTAPEERGKGYFTSLLKQIQNGARIMGVNIETIAYENTSYPIFIKNGFKDMLPDNRHIKIIFDPTKNE